jgi:hypothetical protein
MKQAFKAKLEAKGPGGAWTFMAIPFDVHEVFGSRGRIAVAGTMNGFEFRNSLMPEGDGTHSMAVNKELRAGAKAQTGDIVAVTLEKDEKERQIAAPADLEKALRKNNKAASVFAALSYSCRKEYIDWITGAKQEATRANRIGKAVEMLAAGQKRLR